MAKTLTKTITKKELRSQVSEKLMDTFKALKANVDEKRFRKNIKQASKALVSGFKTMPSKNANGVKKS